MTPMCVSFKQNNPQHDHITELADRPFSLSRLHSSGQRLKIQVGLQQTSVTEKRAECGIFLNT